MRKTVFTIIIAMLGLIAQAQYVGSLGNKPAKLGKRIPLDRSFMECVYSYKVHDPIDGRTREEFKILEIGNNYSQYSSYGAYQVDSIIKLHYPDGLTKNEYYYLRQGRNPTLESVVKNLGQKVINVYDYVFIDDYEYCEDFPTISWKLEPGTLTICGQVCHKATARFRGRNWTAWYSDIPQNNGPWKFCNLPGLILKVEDDKKEQIFEAIQIRNSDKEFGLIKLKREKTTREKYNKALADYKTTPRSFLMGNSNIPLPTDANGKVDMPNDRLFFNPIELE